MSDVSDILDSIRKQIAPSDETLDAVRSHRDVVKAAAILFKGVLRTYSSGSIAHFTANQDTDADCGVVLDRRSYPQLGPDGRGDGPDAIVEEFRSFLREQLVDNHPAVAFRKSKRAVKVTFHEELSNGTDPTVDIIVALTRKDGALWIPNCEDDDWDASDPEKHTELLTDGADALRRTRRRVIRLVKAWNKQYTAPALSGFNITALALTAVEEGVGLPQALADFFSYSATDLGERLTPDPAGVSSDIKILGQISREQAAKRLRTASELINEAISNDGKDADAAREALAQLFWQYVEEPSQTGKAALANSLRTGNEGVGIAGGIGVVLRTAHPEAATIKTTRSFGNHQD